MLLSPALEARALLKTSPLVLQFSRRRRCPPYQWYRVGTVACSPSTKRAARTLKDRWPGSRETLPKSNQNSSELRLALRAPILLVPTERNSGESGTASATA